MLTAGLQKDAGHICTFCCHDLVLPHSITWKSRYQLNIHVCGRIAAIATFREIQRPIHQTDLSLAPASGGLKPLFVTEATIGCTLGSEKTNICGEITGEHRGICHQRRQQIPRIPALATVWCGDGQTAEHGVL